MLSTKNQFEVGKGGLLRVTMDDEEGPPCLSTSANQPGMLSFARGLGWT